MRISDILSESMVVAEVVSTSKEDVLGQIAARICDHPSVDAVPETVLEALMNRERLGSTGVGEGVAIPHAKMPGLMQLVACFARVPDGVAFDAIDQKPVRLIFVLLVPENSAGAHLKALARISRLLRNPQLRQRLLDETSDSALYQAFMQEDAKY